MSTRVFMKWNNYKKIDSKTTPQSTQKALLAQRQRASAVVTPFKVIVIGICYRAVLVKLTNWECLSWMQSFSITSANIATNHILLKTSFFGQHFRLRQYGFSCKQFDVISYQMWSIFSVITQTNGHRLFKVIQCHQFWTTIESSYATSY